MPYIAPQERVRLDDLISKLDKQILCSASDMAYVVFRLLYLAYGEKNDPWSVKSVPLKILEDVKLEWFDRILKPHSKKKIEEHGDII